MTNKSDDMTDDVNAASDSFLLDMIPSSVVSSTTGPLNVPTSINTVSSSNTAAFRQSKLPPESLKDAGNHDLFIKPKNLKY